jgi:hypothetical protein
VEERFVGGGAACVSEPEPNEDGMMKARQNEAMPAQSAISPKVEKP